MNLATSTTVISNEASCTFLKVQPNEKSLWKQEPWLLKSWSQSLSLKRFLFKPLALVNIYVYLYLALSPE